MGGGDIVSPQINKDNSVTFRILAPKASKVEIEGDFLPAQKIKTPFGEVEAPGRVQLKEGKNGVWEYTSSILPSEMYNYSVYVNDFKNNRSEQRIPESRYCYHYQLLPDRKRTS